MNRRELMAALTGMCSAVGLDAKLDVVAGELKATLAIIHCERRLTPSSLEAIHAAWDRIRKLCPDLPPCIVMENGLRLELVQGEK